MTAILVYSEQTDTALELLGAARALAPQLGLTVSAAVLGAGTDRAAATAAGAAAGAAGGPRAGTAAGAAAEATVLAAHGAAPVYVCTEPALEGLDTAVVAQALAHIVEQAGASVVLLGSTRRGRELGGRLAQRLGAGCVTDAISLTVEDGALVAGRYNLGGATVQRETIAPPMQVVAVMPKIFEAGEAAGAAGDNAVVEVSPGLAAPAVRVVDRRPKEGPAVDLTAAPRIVGVGRGLAKRDDLPLGEGLAAALGAELACTKSLADFGWMADDRIVGLSGAKTAPDVYLAVGVSGQVQHTVGIAQARIIAAVNQDKDAPIFALADYGIVGDLYQVVPALVERLKAL
jgi:electron transfer flavoprotein alpha subunit